MQLLQWLNQNVKIQNNINKSWLLVITPLNWYLTTVSYPKISFENINSLTKHYMEVLHSWNTSYITNDQSNNYSMCHFFQRLRPHIGFLLVFSRRKNKNRLNATRVCMFAIFAPQCILCTYVDVHCEKLQYGFSSKIALKESRGKRDITLIWQVKPHNL